MTDELHKPVLLNEVITLLHPSDGQAYLDLTSGYGGHAAEILSRLGPKGSAALVDRDTLAVQHLENRFKGDDRVRIINTDYESASKQLLEEKQLFDCILADIGVSSPHLDNSDRGFSFMNDGPLDMRMDNTRGITAADIVNTYEEERLANLLYTYGELHNSRQLARSIVQRRPFATTHELASVIHGTHKQRMRLRAQVFQALRIEVNDELGQLTRSLSLWRQLLQPGGRLGVITFHSLEDRIVKQYFQEHGAGTLDSECIMLTKKPVVSAESETVFNPRARSAKLRVLQRK